MTREGFISIEPVAGGVSFYPVPGLSIEAIPVPHRAEWPTETVCVLISGPDRSLLYVPDIDFWDEWDRDLVSKVVSVDVAILDGAF